MSQRNTNNAPSNMNRSNSRGNNLNANRYSFKGKMKDSPISKLLITETRHQSTKYKKVIDTLPLLCTDKTYQDIDDVIQNRVDLVETDFTPTCLDTLPVLCTDKNYQGLDDAIQNRIDLVEADFTLLYPDADQWSTIPHVKIATVIPNDTPGPNTDLHPPTVTMARRTHV